MAIISENTSSRPAPYQLTLDGREISLRDFAKRRQPQLQDLAKEAFDLLKAKGPLRGFELGILIHASHGCPSEGARWRNWTGKRTKSCCPYAATDGWSLAKQLELRNLVLEVDRAWEIKK